MKIGEVISWIGSIASIISLVLTFWIFWQIRNLKKFYIFVNLGSQLLATIQKQEKALSKLMRISTTCIQVLNWNWVACGEIYRRSKSWLTNP